MSWPLPQDYNEAIQCPQGNFRDPDLQKGEAVTNSLGIPMPRSGNFADVYELRCPTGERWAVKCFTREVPNLRERYAAISRHLQDAKLPFTVDFTFLEQGIRVGGRWYPVLKMQWVEGLTLNEFVRKHADKPGMMTTLLQIWVRMAARLREVGIAHADLQHGNVLLVPGSTANSLAVKLVDYDGMYVPALAGIPSGEVGHPCYQHPQRLAERTYTLEVDRFPLLLVATALDCLKVGGRDLWDKHDTGDNLLFREADLRAPVKSPLFHELLKLGDGRAVRLASQTLDALKHRLESVPLLGALLPELHSPPAPKPAAATTKRTTVVKTAATPTAAPTKPIPQPSSAEVLFDFEGEDQPRSRRRRSRDKTSWLKGAAAVSVVGFVLAGGIIALRLWNESRKQNNETRTAQKQLPTALQRPTTSQKRALARDEASEEERPGKSEVSPTPVVSATPDPQGRGDKPRETKPEVVEDENKDASTEPAQPAAAEGFVSLFNGKNLDGWRTHPDQPGTWRVVKGTNGGVLTGSGSEVSHLYSERGDYKDFHLHVEARINEGGNSGVYARALFGPFFPKDKPTFPLGYEAQIFNSKRGDPGQTGSLLAGEGVYVASVRESPVLPEKWFKIEILAQGNRILVKVDDKTTADFMDVKRRSSSGHIVLQQLGTTTDVEFRKIEIKELSAEVVQSSPSRPESGHLPDAKEVAAKAYEKSCTAAREKLLQAFDFEVDRLTKRKGSTDARLKMIETVKEEKQRFASRGRIPWSEPMRRHVDPYLKALTAAQGKLWRVYSALIDAQLKAKNESKAAELRAERLNRLDVQVMAKWRHFVNGGGGGQLVLHSNGRIGSIEAKETWSYANGVLILSWPNPRAPNGAWIDTVQVSADGTKYAGANQQKAKITGIQVKDD